jgi:hypothetical protein
MNKPKTLDKFLFRSSGEDFNLLTAPTGLQTPVTDAPRDILNSASLKWAWACRQLGEKETGESYSIQLDHSKPRPADVALVQVERIGRHTQMETARERRLRLYEGDRLVCVFGNRYATDVYEGRVLNLKRLHLLTGSGVIGTLVSRHRDVSYPTTVSFLGYLADARGSRVNLKDLCFRPIVGKAPSIDVILVVGTGMNTGKTTVTRKLLRALVSRGVRVAGCKLTGTTSPRDLGEMHASGALVAADFSDYGFPSTYGESLTELIQLFDSMVDSCARGRAQVVIMEIADGLLQRETQMLLNCESMKQRVRGVIVSGACSSSALFAVDYLQNIGLDVLAVSGLITNSPLFMREFSSRSSIPLVSSRNSANRLASIVAKRIAANVPEERLLEVVALAD